MNDRIPLTVAQAADVGFADQDGPATAFVTQAQLRTGRTLTPCPACGRTPEVISIPANPDGPPTCDFAPCGHQFIVVPDTWQCPHCDTVSEIDPDSEVQCDHCGLQRREVEFD